MTQHISDTARLEQELSELQAEIQSSLKTVAQLREVQRRFGDLLETYQDIKAFHEQARSDFALLQEKAEELFGELVARGQAQEERFAVFNKTNDERWQAQQEKLVEMHRQLEAGQKNLRTELGLQQREFQGGVEERLELYHQELVKGLESSEGRATALRESFERTVNELQERLKSFGHYAERLDARQGALDEDVTRTTRRLGKRSGGALTLGVLNLLLLVALTGGLFYVLFMGGEAQLKALLGI